MKAKVRRPLFGVALVVFALAAVACQPTGGGTTSGTIEVCKSSANGMAGKAFTFRIDSGAPFTVNGGACSGPKSVPSGSATVTETPAAGTEVQSIAVSPSDRLITQTAASATVSVVANSTAANETKVTFTNQPAGGTIGQLKVCKVGANSALVGQPFSFTENGGPAFSVNAGSPGAPNCSGTSDFQVGTNVNIAELAVANTHVSDISVSDGRGSNVSTSGGTVTATVGSGVTVVTYTNDLNVNQATGFIEVCKQSADRFTSGAFGFTITAPGFTDSESVQVGQCTGPIQVPAGNVNIAEAARFPFQVASIDVVPVNRLVASNTVNGTSTVTVPASSSSADETLVTYTNQAKLGQVKVCKTLDANASAIAGSTFTFDVTSATGASTLDVITGAAGSTACRFLTGPGLPLGSQVAVTERAQPNVRLTTVAVSPSSADAGSAAPTAKLTVQPGVTAALFTNQALGTIEVCKNAADPSTATQTFQFSVNNGAPINVHANACSGPIQVVAGTATVSELAKTNFTLSGVNAVGAQFGENRLVSGTNPVTVNVPFSGVTNETVVTFTNRVNTGQFKVCKVSSEPSLQTTAFTFTFTGGTAALKPGQCTGLSAALPVVDANGAPTTINVSEAPTAGVAVSSIAIDGAGAPGITNPAAGTSSFNIAQGVTTATYTNIRTAP